MFGRKLLTKIVKRKISKALEGVPMPKIDVKINVTKPEKKKEDEK